MVRAWPGGAGWAKIAGNYAPTIEPLVTAARDYGAQQSLFVMPQGPDRDDAVLSECGGMNFMVLIDKVRKPPSDWELCWIAAAEVAAYPIACASAHALIGLPPHQWQNQSWAHT